jgi:Uma2 family endonuclease
MIAYAPVAAETGMTMDEFIRQFEESPFEIINGVRREWMPVLPGHNVIVQFLLELLIQVRESADIIVYFETPFVITERSNWVKGSRIPDLAVFDAKRFAAYKTDNPDWKEKPFVIVPDLCIEVVSKNDDFADVMEKVESYLADGVQLVWVFEPKTRTVTVRTRGSAQAIILHEDDMLDGGAVVAGFRVRVGDVFAL